MCGFSFSLRPPTQSSLGSYTLLHTTNTLIVDPRVREPSLNCRLGDEMESVKVLSISGLCFFGLGVVVSYRLAGEML